MKTLDEVIKAFEECIVPKNVFCNGCYKDDRCKITEVALNYLKQYQLDKQIFAYDIAKRNLELSERNEPLSWDELKQMEGKPVWVEKKHSNLYHMWGLVARIKRYQGHEYAVIKCPDLCNSPMSNIRLYDTMYLNDGWQAYRKERK